MNHASIMYLGVTLDHHFNLHGHLTTVFKKATSRLKLLLRIRVNVTPAVVFCIYNVIGKSQMTQCSSILLELSRHWVEKFERLHEKANTIFGGLSSILFLSGQKLDTNPC